MRRDGDEATVVPVRLDDLLEGKWRLQRKIGEGGMGTVYLAQDLALDRLVAVKILSGALMQDPEVVARFEREAKLTASLEHPNIVPVYAVGRLDTRPFMVMKKLEGQTLADLLHSKGGLSLPETLALMRQLCAGLEFIHSKSYVHRDIKAGNLFVGPDGHATILDFGILRPSRETQALTRTGVVMGTPQYMSPEQALGAKDVDHRADLYALAVVLYECLTGTLPFEAESELQMVQLHAHHPPPDLVARAPWISRAVADVVVKALSKRPDERYGSARELFAALEEAARAPAGERPLATPVRTSPVARADHTLPSQRNLQGGVTPAPPPLAPGPDTRALKLAVRPRRTAFTVGLGLAVLLLGGGYLAAGGELQFQEDPEGGPQTSVADAGSSGLALVQEDPPDGGEAEDAGQSLVLSEVEPPPDVEVPDAGPPLEARPVPRQVQGGSGKISVVTTHAGEPYWAVVKVDGVVRGRTPLLLELPAGRHLVRVDRTGFRTEERQIKVASGRSAVLRIALTQ